MCWGVDMSVARVQALNSDPLFIDTLVDLTMTAIKKPVSARPARCCGVSFAEGLERCSWRAS